MADPRFRCVAQFVAVALALALGMAAEAASAAAAAASSASGVEAVIPAITSPTTAGMSACPESVTAGSRCVFGRDGAGAYTWLVVPPSWNGTLVVHAHGGPALGTVKPERASEDLKRWAIWNRAGYAYAGTSYRQGGVALTWAAEDVERARQQFVTTFGAPARTIVHGQSWGAGVAAKVAALYGDEKYGDEKYGDEKYGNEKDGAGKRLYDGALLTSGVLGLGTPSYDFRLDLRVVYQAVCHNHPLPSEPSYPLWQGLPPGSTLTRAELAARVDACTGVRSKAEARSAEQQRRLDTITRVVGIPARSLIGHLNWATWHFQDIVFNRLSGGNPFGNVGVRYSGSADDAALNAEVARYAADPSARAAFDADAGLARPIDIPVLTVHAVDDPTALVGLESTFAQRMAQLGSGDRLVQVFTADREHSYLADAEYVAAMASLLRWIEQGDKPAPQGIASACKALGDAFDAMRGCRFLADFRPPALALRVPAR